MKTKAVRIYGVEDLRLEEFELPAIKDDEILAKIVSDSICMSTFKLAEQGKAHKRAPKDIDQNPVIVGHEFCGEIVEVGAKWQEKFKPGQKFAIQPNINPNTTLYAPGYSYQYCGGDAQYVIIPARAMEVDALLNYENDVFYFGSLAEPMSCIIGGFHSNYHTTAGVYEHRMGIVEGGNMALLAGVGPMGLGAIDYALHCDRKPGLLVVTDIDDARLERAASIYTVEHAKECGVDLHYVNTKEPESMDYIMGLSGGKGYDDVFVYAPVKPVVEQGNKLLGFDGCLNFFAGPTNTEFSAMFNFYNVHYAAQHICGNSGGNTDDMIEAITMMNKGLIDPSAMITHVGGLDAAAEATINLPKIPGGKKLIYTHISMPLTAIADFAKLGETDPMFAKLAEIVEANSGIWCPEAEKFLLANAKAL